MLQRSKTFLNVIVLFLGEKEAESENSHQIKSAESCQGHRAEGDSNEAEEKDRRVPEKVVFEVYQLNFPLNF